MILTYSYSKLCCTTIGSSTVLQHVRMYTTHHHHNNYADTETVSVLYIHHEIQRNLSKFADIKSRTEIF